MPITKDIIRGTVFEPEYYELAVRSRFDEHLSFLVADSRSEQPGEWICDVIGFGEGYWQVGLTETEVPTDVDIDANTELQYVPKELRTLSRHSRGVGPRLYNSPQALRGTVEDPSRVGAYLISIDPYAVADMRRPDDTTPKGIRRQQRKYARQWISSKLIGGLQGVVDAEHARQLNALPNDIRNRGIEAQEANELGQGPVDAAIYSQGPDSVKRMKEVKADVPPIPEAMLIIRNSHIHLRKIGEYQRHRD